MKKQINRALTLIITGIILGASQLASAQADDHVVVNIPFAFAAGDRQLPAGRYTVRRVRLDSTALVIRSEDGRESAMVLTNATGNEARQVKLTFRQYGGHHFLAGVWLPGANGGRELPESKTERSLRREQAAKAGGGKGSAAQTVNVYGVR